MVHAGVVQIVTYSSYATFRTRSYPHIKVWSSGLGPWAIALSRSWLGSAVWAQPVRCRALSHPRPAPRHGHLGQEVVPAWLVASLIIPVCSAAFPDASGSSDSQLAACLDRFGIGKLDWKLPSTPHATSLTICGTRRNEACHCKCSAGASYAAVLQP